MIKQHIIRPSQRAIELLQKDVRDYDDRQIQTALHCEEQEKQEAIGRQVLRAIDCVYRNKDENDMDKRRKEITYRTDWKNVSWLETNNTHTEVNLEMTEYIKRRRLGFMTLIDVPAVHLHMQLVDKRTQETGTYESPVRFIKSDPGTPAKIELDTKTNNASLATAENIIIVQPSTPEWEEIDRLLGLFSTSQ